jgi:HSP20 family protein
MASFFEKLKKGMGVDVATQEKEEIKRDPPEEKPAEKPKRQKAKKEQKVIEEKVEEKAEEVKKIDEPMEQKNEIKIEKKEPETKEKWAGFSKDQEGQLAIDVYQTEEFLVLQSAIAGVKPDSLDIVIENDMVSIKGNREKPEESGQRNYFYQECFWGPFSRQIILSVEVDPSRAEALLKEGILTIRLPKIERDKKRKLVVKG